MCVYVCLLRSQRRTLDPMEVDFQAVVSGRMWVTGTELESSGRNRRHSQSPFHLSGFLCPRLASPGVQQRLALDSGSSRLSNIGITDVCHYT